MHTLENIKQAVDLVNMRLQQSMGDLFHNRLVTARADIPRRTDIDAPGPTTARISTCCSASRKAGATGVAADSRYA